ncbi:MAG TPA: serine/threonine-protein kinase, partial [Kofleriaceae bacterium]|nr:serine/threonine-protein kinase [Kofleriaceae bacterium]
MAVGHATTIGRYEIIERLAVGGMAELFKARSRGVHGFERRLVIKKILPKLAADDEFVRMFIDEARITAQLHHAKIVQVLELGFDGDELFIAMEYVDGIDVLDLLKRCKKRDLPLPRAMAVHIAGEVLEALAYAHEATDEGGKPLHIIHRDVSPGNVLISRAGDVKLTDFGIARASERQQETQAGTLKGKYNYMSPELIAQRPLDCRSDLFSVGVMLAEMLIGTRLFSAASDLDLLLQVRDAKLDRLDQYGAGIPANLRAILDHALTVRPDDRYGSAAEFREQLADWSFASGQRVGARELAAFVGRVMEPTEDDDGRVIAELEPESTISGPATQAQVLSAKRQAEIGRGLYRSQTPAIGVKVSATADAIPARDPDQRGHLDQLSPFRLLHASAAEGRTGLLVVDRPDVLESIYLVNGHPTLVQSSVASDLGGSLVSRGAISEADLARTMELLPYFNGRMSDTLAGLGLMTALEAFRSLSDQAARHLADVCTWHDGRYRWFAGETSPRLDLPLRLDTYEVLGAGATQLDRDTVYAWAQSVSRRKPRAIGDGPENGFGLADYAAMRAQLD